MKNTENRVNIPSIYNQIHHGLLPHLSIKECTEISEIITDILSGSACLFITGINDKAIKAKGANTPSFEISSCIFSSFKVSIPKYLNKAKIKITNIAITINELTSLINVFLTLIFFRCKFNTYIFIISLK